MFIDGPILNGKGSTGEMSVGVICYLSFAIVNRTGDQREVSSLAANSIPPEIV